MKIFLSYAHEHRPTAELLATGLASRHEVFFDKTSIDSDDNFTYTIRTAIEECELFVFLITPESVEEASYCRLEVDRLQGRDEPVERVMLAVMLEETPLGDLPPYVQRANQFRPTGYAVDSIMMEIEDRVERSAQAAGFAGEDTGHPAPGGHRKGSEPGRAQPGMDSDVLPLASSGPPEASDHEVEASLVEPFQNFEVRFGPASAEQYRLTLVGSPGGAAETELCRLDVEGLRKQLSAASERVDELVRDDSGRAVAQFADDGSTATLPTLTAARNLGTELFLSFNSTSMWERFNASASAGTGADNSLRLVINATETPDLAQLPWEFLFDPVQRRFAAFDPARPIIRTLDTDRRPTPVTIETPLRLLVAIAAPPGRPELAVSDEMARLDGALRHSVEEGTVQVERLDQLTVKRLDRALNEFEPHLLHIIGHGGRQNSDDGYVVIGSSTGREARELTGDQLGVLLHGYGPDQPRLVFLNSCHGAAASVDDSFSGMAQMMLRQGVPAVIAMQFPIPDTAAVDLAGAFYQHLARDVGRAREADLVVDADVAASLSAARGFLYADDRPVEWGAPALFLADPAVPLFRLDGAKIREAGAVRPFTIPPASAAEVAVVGTVPSMRSFGLPRFGGPGQGDSDSVTLGGGGRPSRLGIIIGVVLALGLAVVAYALLSSGRSDEHATAADSGTNTTATTTTPATVTPTTDTIATTGTNTTGTTATDSDTTATDTTADSGTDTTADSGTDTTADSGTNTTATTESGTNTTATAGPVTEAALQQTLDDAGLADIIVTYDGELATLSGVVGSAERSVAAEEVLARFGLGAIDNKIELAATVDPGPSPEREPVDPARVRVTFAPGSHLLTEAAERQLDAIARYLAADPNAAVAVHGHADSVGPSSTNLTLSERRAQAGIDHLLEAGVDPNRLSAIGFGERRPLASKPTAAGRASNRRIDFVVGTAIIHTVQRGESLSSIARLYYQDGNRWPEIFRANQDRISDPDWIDIGDMLRIPPNA